MQSGFLEEILGCTRGLSVPRKWAEIPFAEAFFPWLQRARERLKQRMTVSSARVSDEAMACLEGELLRRWSEVCSPACVLEMHIVKMQEELKGETSEERFRDYVQRFLGEETYLRTFFTEYEVMLQWVKSALELWVDKVFELLKDLESDYEGLSSRFGRGKELGVLKEIKSGLSDPHNGNRVVYELLFDSGVSVFYKPKSQKVDATFNALLQDLSSRGLKLPLKGFGVWDCGSYE